MKTNTPRISSRALFRSAPVLSLTALTVLPFAVLGETGGALISTPPLPDVGLSLLRVLGALALVLAVFLGGVWLFRNWQRVVVRRGQVPQLNVLEVRSLGGRHALYVVGYEQERFLIASSPAGISLVSHLQSPGDAAPDKNDGVRVSFAQTLTHLLNGK